MYGCWSGPQSTRTARCWCWTGYSSSTPGCSSVPAPTYGASRGAPAPGSESQVSLGGSDLGVVIREKPKATWPSEVGGRDRSGRRRKGVQRDDVTPPTAELSPVTWGQHCPRSAPPRWTRPVTRFRVVTRPVTRSMTRPLTGARLLGSLSEAGVHRRLQHGQVGQSGTGGGRPSDAQLHRHRPADTRHHLDQGQFTSEITWTKVKPTMQWQNMDRHTVRSTVIW